MVPLRIDDCVSNSAWEASRQKPSLVLQDVTASKGHPAKKSVRRSKSSRLENIVFSVALVAVVLFFLFSFAASLAPIVSEIAHRDQFAGKPVALVTVGTGDTLWKYANRYGSSDTYILDRVDAIARFNHLSPDATLVRGQHLQI